MDPQTNHEKSSIYELVTETTEVCEICYNTRFTEKYVICKCGHNFCSLCFSDYYKTLKSNGRLFPFICPVGGCSKDIHSSLRHVLDETELETYKKQMKKFGLLRNPTVVWCQIVNCEGYGTVNGNSPVKCNECDVEINSTLNPSAKELIDQMSLVQCPGCKALILRTFGCLETRCYCGTEFCSKCGKLSTEPHSKWICIASDQKNDLSYWCIFLALFSPILAPVLPVFIVYLYRNYWDRNYISVLNEYPYFYFALILIFSPMILVFSLFYLPFIWGWYCLDGVFGGKSSTYTGGWVILKILIYFPAVFLTFLGWLLLLSLLISFAPLYGIALTSKKLNLGVKKV